MLRFLKQHPGKAATALVILIAAAALLWAFRDRLDADRWIDFGNTLPIPVLILAFLVLPLLGVPITIFLVLAGMRFGVVNGMLISTACIFFHNVAAYKLTHGIFRRRLRAWLESRGRSIPPIRKERQVLYTGLFAAVSGPPYAFKLYLSALADIPFRVYLWVGAPIYAVFSLIPVATGAAASSIKPVWIVAVLAGAFLLTLGLRWAVNRFQRRVARAPKA
ncbi:hypothetical protein [Haloferula sargassicola]|uniref:TVP38/TMEM64 family membrane protein n=1 Tax=Haloferula sargassicola TaxID=490096 RepID=A0ABP9UQI4_9BACT